MNHINIIQCDHPLIKYKIKILGNKNIGTNEFHTIIEEIAMMIGYEALKDLELENIEIETLLEKVMCPEKAGGNTNFTCRSWYGRRLFEIDAYSKSRVYRPISR